WRFLAAGPPLRQMASAAIQARAGEILVSPEAWALFGEAAQGPAQPTGHHLLTTLVAPAHPLSASERPLPDDCETALAAFLPRIVRAQIEAGLTEWLGEYRRVTTLFVNVPEVDDGAPDALARLQQITTTFQRAIYHYGGSVNQLLMDDKGTILIGAWGGSRHAHEDDAVRAVQAAQALRRELAAIEMSCS